MNGHCNGLTTPCGEHTSRSAQVRHTDGSCLLTLEIIFSPIMQISPRICRTFTISCKCSTFSPLRVASLCNSARVVLPCLLTRFIKSSLCCRFTACCSSTFVENNTHTLSPLLSGRLTFLIRLNDPKSLRILSNKLAGNFVTRAKSFLVTPSCLLMTSQMSLSLLLTSIVVRILSAF